MPDTDEPDERDQADGQPDEQPTDGPGEVGADRPSADAPVDEMAQADGGDAPAHDAPTEVMEPVQDAGETAVMPPVVEPEGRDGEDASDALAEVDEPAVDRDWLGIVGFVAGALLISIVAIILGHLGLSAAKRGRARHRSFAIAALILGYLGLVVTAAGVWLYLDDTASPEELDIQAQQDVSAVGAAAATAAIETGALPQVAQDGDVYVVAGETIAPALEVEHTLTFTGTAAADWCLEIAYEGGEQPAFSYTATGGMAEGTCAGG